MAYQGWYKYIRNDASDKAVGIKVEIEIGIEGWDTQWFKSLIVPS